MLILIFLIPLVSCALPSHQVARDYYKETLYDKDPRVMENLSSGKTSRVFEENKKVQEILNKSEWRLDDCVAVALANEEQLKIKGEEFYKTKWQYLEAISNWLPKASLGWSHTNWDKNIGLFFSDETDYWLTLHQPIFNAGSEIIALTNSKHFSELKRWELKQFRDSLIFSVAQAFYGVIELQKELYSLQAMCDYLKEHLEHIKALEEAGLARHRDLLLAEADLYSIKSRIVDVTSQIEKGRLALQLLVGGVVPPQKLVDTLDVDVPRAVENIDVNDVLISALKNRYDIKMAEEGVSLSDAEVKLAKASYLPSVNLDWTRYLHYPVGGGEDWMALLSISLPIDNGTRFAKLQETYSGYRQKQLYKKNLINTVDKEVRESYHDLLTLCDRIESLKKSLEAAKESFEIISEEYKAGTSTNVEVLYAKNSFENARISLENANIELKVLYLKWLFVQGTLGNQFLMREGKK